jgi:hypothetical protein
MRWVVQSTPVYSYELGFTLAFVTALLAAVGIYLVVSRLSGTTASLTRNFAAFGYAYIPLVLAVHLGHNSIHLWGEGPAAVRTAFRAVGASLGISAPVETQGAMSQLSLVVMAPLVLVGGLASLYVAWRVGERLKARGEKASPLPHLVFLAVLTGLFVLLFFLPMNPRHAH